MANFYEWLLLYYLIANAKKFPLVDKTISIEDVIIKSSNAKVLLGTKINSNLSFSDHMAYLCATANI